MDVRGVCTCMSGLHYPGGVHVDVTPSHAASWSWSASNTTDIIEVSIYMYTYASMHICRYADMHMHIYTHTRMCMCVCMCVRVCGCGCECTCEYAFVWSSAYRHMCIPAYVSKNTCLCGRICVGVHANIHMHVHAHTRVYSTHTRNAQCTRICTNLGETERLLGVRGGSSACGGASERQRCRSMSSLFDRLDGFMDLIISINIHGDPMSVCDRHSR